MKKIILIAFLTLSAFATQAQKINWITVEEAAELMKTAPRKVILDAYTVWCGPCKALDKNTFSNPDVAKYINENFYAVKFNAEGNETINFKGSTYTNPGYDPAREKRRNTSHQFAQYLSIRAYPTLVYFDEKFDLIAPISSYMTPKQLELYLKLFATDKYKEVTTKEDWEAYQKQFVSEFKS